MNPLHSDPPKGTSKPAGSEQQNGDFRHGQGNRRPTEAGYVPVASRSSKLKEVWIQLYRFTFSHHTSIEDNTYDKFIGRENTVKKLENLITNSETHSGAYLVTGFRGMGKTSLINKTLRKIKGGHYTSKVGHLFRAWLFLAFSWYFLPYALNLITVFSVRPTLNPLGRLLLLCGSIISFAYFLSKNKAKLNYSRKIAGKQPNLLNRLRLAMITSFNIFKHDAKNNSLVNILQICLGNLLIGLASLVIHGINETATRNMARFDPDSFTHVSLTELTKTFFLAHYMFWFAGEAKQKVYHILEGGAEPMIIQDRAKTRNRYFWLPMGILMLLCGFYLLSPIPVFSFWASRALLAIITVSLVTIILFNWYIQRKVINRGKKINGQGFRDWVKGVVNYGDFCTVKINLGQDDLKELDVLRLITNATLHRYRQWYRSKLAIKKFVWLGVILISLAFLTKNVSELAYTSGMVNEFRIKSGILNYFPSQAAVAVKLVVPNIDSFDKLLNDSTFNLPAPAVPYKTGITVNQKIAEAQYLLNLGAASGRIPAVQLKAIRSSDGGLMIKLRSVCILVDQFLAYAFRALRDSAGHFLSSTTGFIDRATLLPNRLDYFEFFILLIYYLLYKAIVRLLPLFGVKTNHSTISYLHRISVNIDANVTQTDQQNLLFKTFGGLTFTRQHQFMRLDAKDLEGKLIYFFDQLDQIPSLFVKPKFIYIFDELDKIEPSNRINPDNVREDAPEGETAAKVEGMRVRQQVIAKLLANLKFFLNTAKAKFIFIAGREMYDASLADVSDRDSSIGSIFHDVLYVESFYTDWDEGKTSNIMDLTEQYVCQFLLPSSYFVKKPVTLSTFNSYLQDHCSKNGDALPPLEQAKIILSLYNFITYLVYRSNGSPKKVAALFEDFVRFPSEADLIRPHNLVRGEHVSEPYLYFGPDEQYKIGLTTYLFTPFLMTVSHHFHELGDKLLVSTTYLMDHLYKFHSYGFSWRNLELTPEIIAINKAPELREFINELINFLSKNHIRQIESGLHEYKFNKKFSSEIQYVSKISELESAAFNFTLDESLEVKRYYRKRCQDLKKNYGPNYQNEDRHVHSISFVQMILGDLHYYDQEYDDAIIHYMEAVQVLRNVNKEKRSLYNFVLLMRNMLKMGLAFEHKQTYESAFMIYSQLSTMVVDSRAIDVKVIGLEEFILREEDLQLFTERHHERILMQPGFKLPEGKTLAVISDKEKRARAYQWLKQQKFKDGGSRTGTIRVIGRRIPKKPGDTNGSSANGSNSINDWTHMDLLIGFEDNFFDKVLVEEWYSFEKSEIYQNISLQEGLRLFYQPIIAKLQIVEKNSISGLTSVDLERADEEFDFIYRSVRKDEKHAIEVEYYNKTADLLYYKNGRLLKTQPPDEGRDCRVPHAALERYVRSLYVNLINGIPVGEDCSGKQDLLGREEAIIRIIAGYINKDLEPKFLKRSYNFLNSCASGMSDIANCLICMVGKKERIDLDFMGQLFRIDNEEKLDASILRPEDHLNKALFFYFCSAALFRRLGNNTRYYAQLLKVVQFLGICLRREADAKTNENEPYEVKYYEKLYKAITDKLVPKALKAVYRLYEHANRVEYSKLRNILGIPLGYQEDPGNHLAAGGSTPGLLGKLRPYVYRNASAGTEAKELLLATLQLGLQLGLPDVEPFVDELCGIDSTVTTIHVHIQELRLRARKNFMALQQILKPYDSSQEPSELGLLDRIMQDTALGEDQLKHVPRDLYIGRVQRLCIDSIYCMSKIIQFFKLSGINYITTTHSFLAKAHERMGFWCELLLLIRNKLDKESDQKIRAEQLAGLEQLIQEYEISDLHYLTPWLHYEIAVREYNKAIQVHHEGLAYKKLIRQFYYLDDDFDDSVLHFSFACERFQINSGRVRDKIKRLKKKLGGHHLYQFDTYFETDRPLQEQEDPVAPDVD